MTEDSMDGRIAALTNKIDREFRLTRSLVLLCTAAILGVILYTITITYTDIPKLNWATFQENLQITHDHWKALDRTFDSKGTSILSNPAEATDEAK